MADLVILDTVRIGCKAIDEKTKQEARVKIG